MDHRSVILDGITVQHVGEILYDSPTTAPIRNICAYTYRRSLEDFAFGVLFGETLTVSSRMPPVGDSTPGAVVLREPSLKEFVVAVDMEKPKGIANLLNETDFRASVQNDLEILAQLSNLELESFIEFYLREIKAYLGNDSSILKSNVPVSEYIFSTPNRESHYVKDSNLQRIVGSSFYNHIITSIKARGKLPEVSDDALHEFISRALLTHVANYWAFDYAVEGQPHGSARLPHVTRSLIRKKADSTTFDKATEKRLRRLVYRGVVPHALLSVIVLARDKNSFIDALRETRDSEQFRQIRRYLTELVVKLGHGERKGADKLLAEIARKAGESMVGHEPLQLSVPVVGGFSISSRAVDGMLLRMNPGKYYLRQLVRRSPYISELEYITRLADIFPELGGIS